ncbi:MAG: TnpV protein [Oscillospiraceae bacterium]|nr:TnpV protein [Oscillospiraceae bacterium]
MRKQKENRSFGGENMDYTLCGDYYLPNLLPVQEEEYNIGIYGQRYFRYIKEHDRILFINLLTTGKLNKHIVEIDRRAQNMKAMLIKQIAKQEGINETLKEQNQIEWVKRMNNIQNRAEEIISKEIFK